MGLSDTELNGAVLIWLIDNGAQAKREQCSSEMVNWALCQPRRPRYS
jgi:hypothetical protein